MWPRKAVDGVAAFRIYAAAPATRTAHDLRWLETWLYPSAMYRPCLPSRVKSPPSGEHWIHEIKFDGFRLLAQKEGTQIRLRTKQGADYSGRYSGIVDGLSRLKVSSIVLDGEAMCFTGVQQDFDKLWNRTHDHEAKLCAFDLLELNGQDFRARPLLERKKQLFKIIRRSVGIEYVEHLIGDGSQIFEHACKLGLEGIVSKRGDKPYASGVSKFWLKTKNRNHPAMERVREAFRNR